MTRFFVFINNATDMPKILFYKTPKNNEKT